MIAIHSVATTRGYADLHEAARNPAFLTEVVSLLEAEPADIADLAQRYPYIAIPLISAEAPRLRAVLAAVEPEDPQRYWNGPARTWWDALKGDLDLTHWRLLRAASATASAPWRPLRLPGGRGTTRSCGRSSSRG